MTTGEKCISRLVLLLVAVCSGGVAQEPLEVAGAALRAGRLAEAERILNSARPDKLKAIEYGFGMTMVASGYAQKHDYASAERVSQALLDWYEQQFGGASPQVGTTLTLAGELALRQGKYGEAEAAYGRALEILHARLSANCLVAGSALTGLGEAFLGLKRYQDARNLLLPEIAACEKQFGADATGRAELLNVYAVSLELAGEKDRAREAETEADRVGTGGARFQKEARDLLRARLLAAAGRTDEAVALCRKWVAVFEVPDGDESDRRLVIPLSEWERILHLAGRAAEAAQVGARLAEIRAKYKM